MSAGAAGPGGADAIPAELRAGVALFNRGAFYEAHEVVERRWLAEPRDSPRRALLAAFIQMAGAYLLATQGRRWRGAARLFRSSRAYFAPYRPRALGLDVEEICRALERGAVELDRLARGEIAVFDRGLIPVLTVPPAGEPPPSATGAGGPGTHH